MGFTTFTIVEKVPVHRLRAARMQKNPLIDDSKAMLIRKLAQIFYECYPYYGHDFSDKVRHIWQELGVSRYAAQEFEFRAASRLHTRVKDLLDSGNYDSVGYLCFGGIAVTASACKKTNDWQFYKTKKGDEAGGVFTMDGKPCMSFWVSEKKIGFTNRLGEKKEYQMERIATTPIDFSRLGQVENYEIIDDGGKVLYSIPLPLQRAISSGYVKNLRDNGLFIQKVGKNFIIYGYPEDTHRQLCDALICEFIEMMVSFRAVQLGPRKMLDSECLKLAANIGDYIAKHNELLAESIFALWGMAATAGGEAATATKTSSARSSLIKLWGPKGESGPEVEITFSSEKAELGLFIGGICVETAEAQDAGRILQMSAEHILNFSFAK